MKTLDERFAQALHSSARCWRHVLDRHLKASGLSQAGWMALAEVAESNAAAPPSQTDLALRLGVEGATMVAMLDRLVATGLVLRVPSGVDRRIKLVVATEQGQALYRRVKVEADALRAVLLKTIDRSQMAIAADVLEQLQAILVDAS